MTKNLLEFGKQILVVTFIVILLGILLALACPMDAATIPLETISTTFTNQTTYDILFHDFDTTLGELSGVNLNLTTKILLSSPTYSSTGGNAGFLAYEIEDGTFYNIFSATEPCTLVGFSTTCYTSTQRLWTSGLAAMSDGDTWTFHLKAAFNPLYSYSGYPLMSLAGLDLSAAYVYSPYAPAEVLVLPDVVHNPEPKFFVLVAGFLALLFLVRPKNC